MAALFLTAYTSQELHKSLPIEGNIYNETDQYQSKGFVYSFLHTWRHSRITKPDFYEQYKARIEAAETQIPPVRPTAALPNIVMVLSEAFSDLALSDAVSFNKNEHPLRHYLSVKEESLASGYLVSPNIGGGTADMEFDILTGINTRDFRGVPYTFTMVTQPFPGLVKALVSAGYEANTIHPGTGWFYNRQNVYPLLGVNAFYDEAVFDRRNTKGGYISEQHTIDILLQEYRSHAAPSFLKAITIQNHGPYHGKYRSQPRFELKTPLSGDDTDALANYFEGLKDSDEGLYRLVSYFRSVSEPVVLLYYGDHLPSLPLTVYRALIPEPDENIFGEDLIRFNRVPFLIWANDAGRPLIDTDAFNASLPHDRTVSAYYLGAALLEMLGLDEGDSFMRFLNGIRAEYPISLESAYRGADGVFRPFDPEVAPELAQYKSWSYYRIMNP